VNSSFGQNISKIEELSTGAVFCQIFHECMPGTLKFSKVNWSAKHDYEYINNFKLLQEALTKANVNKNVEIGKLVRGKCQDNLELLQWIRRFFDCNSKSIEKRKATPNPRSKILTERNGGDRSRNTEKSVDSVRTKKETFGDSCLQDLRKSRLKTTKVEVSETSKILMDNLQKERDFYFEKLREIELQVSEFAEEDHPLVKKLQSILYLEE
jgi:RP/EB family microtubule-associated protein